METNVIGVFNKEVFIYDGENSVYGGMNMNVIRPVEKDVLDDLRTIEGLKNYGWDDLWKGAVSGGFTELGLDDWIQEALDNIGDDEDFPGKDDSYTDEMSCEIREKIDNYLLDEYNFETGTWECSGSFTPSSVFGKEFKGFDLIINPDLAEKYYKEIGLVK